MDAELFVKNVKEICLNRDIKPTVACKESGVGGSFINDIERGRVPSVAKVMMLAAYLGTTTSELLGEKQKAPPESGGEKERYDKETSEAIAMYLQLDAGDRGEIRGVMREKLKGEKYSGKQKLLNA